MGNETLLDSDIAREATEHHLLDPFESQGLKGASYYIRVGDRAIVAYPDGYRHTALNGQKTIDIPPNHAATIRAWR